IDHAPATLGTYSDPVTSSTFWGGEAAVVQIQLQQPATVAEITRLANAVSNQLTAESVVIVGMAPADPATWTATASNPAVNCGSLIGWAESPLVCMWRAVRGPVLVVVIVGLGYVAYRRGWWRDAEQLLRTPRRPIRRPRAAHATR
ncbi:MAG: hypothetical protein ACRETL_13085, partial [Gammaproteobacteria bacterium]